MHGVNGVIETNVFISLHIRSMWETICDAQAGLCTHSSNSKICVQISRKPLSGFQTRKSPPPMKNFRFEMTKVYSRIPAPQLKNFRFEMTKVYSGIPPPPPIGLQSRRSHVETNMYPPWMPLVSTSTLASLRESAIALGVYGPFQFELFVVLQFFNIHHCVMTVHKSPFQI